MTHWVWIAMAGQIGISALLIWFWFHRADEMQRGREAFREWRKVTPMKNIGGWEPYPMHLMLADGVFFRYGALREMQDERMRRLKQMRKHAEEYDAIGPEEHH